jgi:outer membrane protease
VARNWTSAVAAAVALAALAPGAAGAGEFDDPSWPKVSLVTYHTGLRYWYASGNTAKDLYDTTGSLLVSRLTYEKLGMHSGEAFLRGDHSNGMFLKGYVGAGGIISGNLQDEDFVPATIPYSSTNSAQKNGSLVYGSLDVGYKIVRGGDFNIGAFVGYHYLNQKVEAYGCSQTAGSSICAPAIPDIYLGISQTNNWHSARVGLDANFDLTDRLKLSVEAAWLPYVSLYGSDTHWWRIGSSFTGAIPEDGKGWGYQFEGVLAYQVNQALSVGVGGRYWHMETTKGLMHFEDHIVGGGGSPQQLRWTADNYGMFLQGSIKLGPYKNDLF